MKLEDVLDAENIAAIDSLGEEVRLTVEDTVGRYKGITAGSVAYGLGGIAYKTKDKDAVVEAARMIRRYEKGAALSIAYWLRYIAYETKDKDTVVEAARTLGKYKGEAAGNVAYWLGNIASDTNDKADVMTACALINNAGSNVLDFLQAEDIVEIRREKLYKLIDGKESLDVVSTYLKSKGELPLPTKDNINGYSGLVGGYLSKTYGIGKGLDRNQILMLFSVGKEERSELAGLINASVEKDRKSYSIDITDTDKDRSLKMEGIRLPYLSVIAVIGSRDPENEKEAVDTLSSIVGEKTVRQARNAFNSSYRKSLLSEIISSVKGNDIDNAVSMLKDTKNERINDVLAAADYKGQSISGKNVLSAVESNNPLDYDSRIQIACVYLPRDFHDGIQEYCKDDRFTLVKYDINGKTLGSAICYHESDTFLVDSVEGHRTFRKPQIFDAVYRDLIDRANEKGCKKIIFSEDGFNETPKEFIGYLGSAGLKKGKIKMKLDTKGYLEADDDAVNGYVVSLEKH